jgi:hypothetical protein
MGQRFARSIDWVFNTLGFAHWGLDLMHFGRKVCH